MLLVAAAFAAGCSHDGTGGAGTSTGGAGRGPSGTASAAGQASPSAAAALAPAALRIAATRAQQTAAGYDFVADASGTLRTYAGRDGARAQVAATAGGVHLYRSESDGFDLRIETTAVGREGSPSSRGVLGQHAEGQELVLEREQGVQERYLAGPLGLEQSYVVGARPQGQGPLTIAVAFAGLTATAAPGAADRVLLRDAAGLVRGGYRDLVAVDATGRELSARMQVGAAGVALVIDDAGAVYPLQVDPVVWTQQATLTSAAEDGAASDNFGYSVSVAGNYAVVGAYHANGNKGAAYIFTSSGSSWSFVHELTANTDLATDGTSGDQFGYSVAVSSDGSVIVGAPSKSTGPSNSNLNEGAVYIFVPNGSSSWVLSSETYPFDGEAGDLYGASVAIVGSGGVDFAVAGAPGRLSNEGTIYTQQSGSSGNPAFTWTSPAISEQYSPDGSSGDRFGSSVAVNGSGTGGTVVVGAPFGNSNHGVAYAFSFSSGSPSPFQLSQLGPDLTAPDGKGGDAFGSSVAVAPDSLVVVGAPMHSVSSHSNQGAAYLLLFNGAAWPQLGSDLTASDGAAGDQFGTSVAASGTPAGSDIVVVGAPYHTVSGHSQQGAAYAFTGDSSGTQIGSDLTATGGAAGDYFGYSVSVTGTSSSATVVAGAEFHTVGSNSQEGAAYVLATVNKTATATAVASSANPSVYGQSVTFTATVSGVDGTADGETVTFYDDTGSGPSQIGTGTLSGGVATFATSALAVGSNHTITTSYAGDGSFTASNGSLTGNPQVVDKSGTTTVVTSTPNPSVWGQSVTFTATVAASGNGAGTPTGSVTFSVDGGPGQAGTSIGGGQWTLTTSSLSVGSHTISASYGGDGNFNASSGDDSASPQVVDKSGTTTVVTSTPNPSVWGQSVTFTATVAAASPGAGTPAGSVSFSVDGGPAQAGTSIGGDQWTFTTTSLSVGSHTITASYGGDGNFNASSGDDSASQQAVNKSDTTTGVTSTPNPTVFGQGVTFTATVTAVSPGAGTPAGSVAFSVDGGPGQAGTSIGGGQWTFTTTSLSVGSHTITASYGGDGNFNASSGDDSASQQIVNKANTSTAVASSVNPSVWGQSVTFTATVTAVSPGAGTPSGTVDFLDGGSPIGSGTLSGGVATFTTSALAVRSHTITTHYEGDGSFLSGTDGPLTGNPQVVNKADTATVVASDANPSVFGQTVTFTATVSAVLPGAGTPSGSVTFYDGGSPIGSGALSGGVATFATKDLSVGSHGITTSYAGDGNFNPSNGSLASNPQVVNRDPTTTLLTSSANPEAAGTSVTFTVTVTANPPGSGTPTSYVNFFDGQTLLGSSVLAGTLPENIATFSTSSLSIGSHTIAAVYNGDPNFESSQSTTSITQVIVGEPSTVTVQVAPSPIVYGQAATLTATVSGGSDTPTGSVTFSAGANALGSIVLAGGVASTPLPPLPPGTYTFNAAYGGDALHTTGSGTATLTISQGATSTTVISSSNPALPGASVTFSASVVATSPATGTPTGTVTFTDGTTTLGTGTLASGVATFTTSTLTNGSHTIVASYAGDTNFAASTSTSLTQTISAEAVTLTLVASPNPVQYGTSSTLTATVTAGGGGDAGAGDAGADGGAAPTGTVTFTDGTTTLGTANLSGGVATLPSGVLSPGTHAITATYNGDASNPGGSTASVHLIVQPAQTTTELAADSSTSALGAPVVLTATVTTQAGGDAGAPDGGGLPALTGTVTFADGTTVLGTVTLGSGGTATLTTTSLPAGAATLTATFTGSADYASSTSAPLAHTVTGGSGADAGADGGGAGDAGGRDASAEPDATIEDAGADADASKPATGDSGSTVISTDGSVVTIGDASYDLGADGGVAAAAAASGCSCHAAGEGGVPAGFAFAPFLGALVLLGRRLRRRPDSRS
jgi:hypothetical protein